MADIILRDNYSVLHEAEQIILKYSINNELDINYLKEVYSKLNDDKRLSINTKNCMMRELKRIYRQNN